MLTHHLNILYYIIKLNCRHIPLCRNFHMRHDTLLVMYLKRDQTNSNDRRCIWHASIGGEKAQRMWQPQNLISIGCMFDRGKKKKKKQIIHIQIHCLKSCSPKRYWHQIPLIEVGDRTHHRSPRHVTYFSDSIYLRMLF
jgi:hypothetical protein